MLKVYYVTGTMQSPLWSLLNLILGTPRGINTVNLIEKLRHKEIKLLAQDYTAARLSSQDTYWSRLSEESILLITGHVKSLHTKMFTQCYVEVMYIMNYNPSVQQNHFYNSFIWRIKFTQHNIHLFKVYKSVFCILTELYIYHLYPTSEHFITKTNL